jgi:hypothetical protein
VIGRGTQSDHSSATEGSSTRLITPETPTSRLGLPKLDTRDRRRVSGWEQMFVDSAPEILHSVGLHSYGEMLWPMSSSLLYLGILYNIPCSTQEVSELHTTYWPQFQIT